MCRSRSQLLYILTMLTLPTFLLIQFFRPRFHLLCICDNVGTAYLFTNQVSHPKMKHVGVDFHFVRNRVAYGSLCVTHVSNYDQLADLHTKPFYSTSLVSLRSKIGVRARPSILKEHI